MPIVPPEHGLGSFRCPYQRPALSETHRVLKFMPPYGERNP